MKSTKSGFAEHVQKAEKAVSADDERKEPWLRILTAAYTIYADEENDAYRMEAGLDPRDQSISCPRRRTTPSGCSSSACSRCRFITRCSVPNWGPSIEGLDMDHIATYVRPKTEMKNDWKDVPQDIKGHLRAAGHSQG